MHNFNLCHPSNKPANFPVVTNEARVYREGPLTSLAQLLL